MVIRKSNKNREKKEFFLSCQCNCFGMPVVIFNTLPDLMCKTDIKIAIIFISYYTDL